MVRRNAGCFVVACSSSSSSSSFLVGEVLPGCTIIAAVAVAAAVDDSHANVSRSVCACVSSLEIYCYAKRWMACPLL